MPSPAARRISWFSALDIAKDPLHPLPLGQTGAHMRVGLRIHEAAATLVEVEQAHEEERRLARQDRPAIFHMEALPLGVPRREGVGPIAAPRLHGLGEDDQRRHLVGMKAGHAHAPQDIEIVAEQPRGGRIGVPDLVGHRIKHQHRLRRPVEGGAIGRSRRRD